MKIKRILRRGSKNSRVLLDDGSEVKIPNDRLTLERAKVPIRLVSTQPTQSVEERFDHLERLVTLVITGHTPSLLICGDAGVGKTFLVRQQLARAGLNEQIVMATDPAPEEGKKKKTKKPEKVVKTKVDKQKKDTYLFVKGYSSPMGLFSCLHDNRSATIVFDDCDSVFGTATSVNILKSALDSYDKRVVSWYSPAAAKMGLESQFEFTGRIIFISNLTEARIDEAVRSRSFLVSICLTRREIFDRMQLKLADIEVNASIVLKQEVLTFLGEQLESFNQFNMRTLIKAIRIRQSEEADWKDMVLKFA